MASRPDPRAFTLVELLVVVGVIALLIGILLPALGGARRTARKLVCQNNLRVLGQGMLGYAAAWNNYLPWDGYQPGDSQKHNVGYWRDTMFWLNSGLQYAGVKPYDTLQRMDAAGTARLPKNGDRFLMVCPDATDGGTNDIWKAQDKFDSGYWWLWGLDDTGGFDRRKTYLCYGYNTQLDTIKLQHVAIGGVKEDRNTNSRVGLKLNWFSAPSITVLLAEKMMNPGEVSPPSEESLGQQEFGPSLFAARHAARPIDGGGFVLFLDGHAGFLTRTEVLEERPGMPVGLNNIQGKVIWNPIYNGY